MPQTQPHIVRERTAIDRQRVRQGIRYKMVYIAALTAVLLVFAVQTGTRYVMNDWSRGKLERVMTNNLHRRVLFGRASWSLGLNGLIIAIDRLVVLDRIGKEQPFITSDYAEVGVPLLPLLAGSLEARSLTFKNPTIYAVQIRKNAWNFSDMPDIDALRAVSYVDVENGKLNIIDQSKSPPASWSPRIFANAKFHLERPFMNRTWPFRLSFRMPHQKYITNILVTGIGNGNVHDWQQNNHQFDLKATSVNLQEFSDAFPQVPPITGLMNVEVHGEGIPQEGFNVNAIVRSPLLTVETPGFGALTVKNAVTSGQFETKGDMLTWNNVVVNLGKSFLLQSNGRLLHWKKGTPSYEATLLAQADDINKLARVLPAQILPHVLMTPDMAARVKADRAHEINIEQALAPAKLTGSVIARARIKGTGKQTDSIWADVDGRNISMARLAELAPLKQNPVIQILGANPRSKLNIHVTQMPDGTAVINKGNIAAGNSHINFGGTINPKTDQINVAYNAHNLNLADVAPAVGETAAMRKLNNIPGLPADTRVKLNGFVDVNGTLITHGTKQTTNAIAVLKNAGLALGNGELRANRVNGKVMYNGNLLVVDNLRGFINKGPFTLTGSVSTTPNGPINVAYKGKTIELGAVKQAAVIMHVNSPLLANKYLRGYMDNVVLVINGTTQHPILTMDGSPRDITFQPPGAKGLVRVIGGNFHVQDNRLTFSGIRGTIGGGNFTIAGVASTSSSNIALVGSYVDISQFRQALLDLHVNAPIITGPQVLFGTLRSAVLSVHTQGKNTQFSLSGSPIDVYYQARRMPRAFLLTGGSFNINNQVAALHNLRGYIGKGAFTLNGRMALTKGGASNIAFAGSNLDLSNVKASLQALNVKSPLLAQQMLYGTVRRLLFNMKGTTEKPVINLVAYPSDVRFEPYGTKRTMRITGGVVTYANDTFTGRDLAILNSRTRIMLSARIEHLSGKSRLTDLHLRSKDIDLGDLNAYLVANSTPATIRERYLAWLKVYGVDKPHGTIAGQVDYSAAHESTPLNLYTNLTLKNIGVTLRGMTIANVNGLIRSEADSVIAQNVTGTMEGAPLRINMVMKNLKTIPTWAGEIASTVNVQRLLTMLPGEAHLDQLVHTNQDIPVRIGVFGTPGRTAFVLTGAIAPTAEFTIQAPIGLLTKPAGQPINMVALMVYRSSKPAVLTFYDSHVDVGGTRLAWRGEYDWPGNGPHEEPYINFTIALENPVNVRTLLSLVPAPGLEEFVANMTGNIGGEVVLNGPLNAPASKGHLDLIGVAVPALNITNITGTLRAEDFFATRKPEQTADITGPTSIASLDLQTLTAGGITLRNIQGQLMSEQTDSGQRWSVNDLTTTAFGGSARINASVLMTGERPFTVEASLSNIDLNAVATQALHQKQGDVTGNLSAYALLNGKARNKDQILSSLTGSSHFDVRDGSVRQLGKLESGLQLLDVAHKGILGFNPAQLLAALGHLHTGAFESVSADARIHDAVVDLTNLAFNGEEMRLRGQGQIALTTHQARFDVAGNIPRNPKSILKGPLGGLLQHLSIANLLNAVTFGLSSHFGDIPLLGHLGVEKNPRAFAFVAQGDLDDPDSFTKSVVKTFHWLPNARFATPHPVFGVGSTPEAVPQ